MQTNDLVEQLAQPSYQLFVADDADVDLSRDMGQAIGRQVFADDDPNRLINTLVNVEAYFHHLRTSALSALKQQLLQGYPSLMTIMHTDGSVKVLLDDGSERFLPGHTAPALNELLTLLHPAEGYENPRLCLELIQQVSRLMLVLGMPKLVLRNESR